MTRSADAALDEAQLKLGNACEELLASKAWQRSSGRYQDEHPLLLKSCRVRRGALDGLRPGFPGGVLLVSSLRLHPSARPPLPCSLLPSFSSPLFLHNREESVSMAPSVREGGVAGRASHAHASMSAHRCASHTLPLGGLRADGPLPHRATLCVWRTSTAPPRRQYWPEYQGSETGPPCLRS